MDTNDPGLQPGALACLWSARSIAIVGASTKETSPGHAVLRYLRRYGYAGAVVPIHPSAPIVAGMPAWPSAAAYRASTDRPVDLALILVPAAAVPAAVDDCIAAGVRVAIVGSSGFAETGRAGREAQDAIVAAARTVGMRIVGPNCIGALGASSGLVASFSPLFGGAETRLSPRDRGGVGFASASGALGFGTVSLALERGMNLHAAVSTGNEADVSALEVLAELAGDPGCTALLGYAESLADVAGLRALVNAAARAGKPIAMLVGGVSTDGARAAASHTGALATSERVVDGVLRQFGIVRVSDVDDLLDVGDAFDLVGARSGDRVAVITTSGGSGILAADEIARTGLRLAALAPETVDELQAIVPAFGSATNPIDVTATVMNDRTLVGRALAAVAEDDDVDVIVVCFCVLVGADVDAIVEALAEVTARFRKPVIVARTGADHLAPRASAALRGARIPVYPTPARAIRAAAALHAARPRPQASPTAASASQPSTAVTPPATGAEDDVKAALEAAGIRVPIGRVVTSADNVLSAVAECHGRAVFKAVVPGLAHKTEVGGVLLGIDAASAETSYQRLMSLPGARGVLVEEQVSGGVELLVGIAGSALGPVLTVGVGGTLTEIIDDAAVRLLPVNRADVLEMIGETRAARLLAGVRGAEPGDADAFVDLVLRVAEIAGSWPGDLDLNPVVVRPHGAVVLDAAFLPATVERLGLQSPLVAATVQQLRTVEGA